MAVVVLLGLLTVGVLTDSGWKGLLLSLLLLATLVDGSTKFFNNTLFFPLEQLRSGSQILNGLVLAAIAVATLRGPGGVRLKIVALIAVALAYSLTVNMLSLNESTMCLRIAGGEGCDEQEGVVEAAARHLRQLR